MGTLAIIGNTVGGGAVSSVQPLRFISSRNVVDSGVNALSGSILNFAYRIPFVIGSGAIKSIVLAFNNFYHDSTGYKLPGNVVNISAVAVEVATSYYPITFSGGRTLAISNGDVNIHSDELNISLARGATGYIRYKGYVSSAGNITKGAVPSSYGANSLAIKYDPAVTTVSTVDATGAFSVTGTAATNLTNSSCPFLLGRYQNGNPPIVVSIGDSILSNGGAKSFVQQGMFSDAGLVNNPISYSEFSASASDSLDWSNVDTTGGIGYQAYFQYATIALYEHGVNSSTLQAWAGDKSIITAMRSAGLVTIRNRLLPYTTSTDGWTTIGNQTPVALADTVNARIAQDYAANEFDYNLDPTSVQYVSDNRYWSVALGTITSDGLYPTSGLGHTTLAPDVRAMMSLVTISPSLDWLKATKLKTTSVTPTVRTNIGNGILYFVLVPNADSPSISQVKAGQQSNGSAAISAQTKSISAVGVQTFTSITGLNPSTGYELFFVHVDKYSVNSELRSVHFTTPAADNLVVFDAVSTVSSDSAGLFAVVEHAPTVDAGVSGIGIAISWFSMVSHTLDYLTYGGVDILSNVQVTSDRSPGRSRIFYLANPPQGRQLLVARFSASPVRVVLGIVSVRGGDDTTVFSNSAAANGLSATPSVTVTTASGELIMDSLYVWAVVSSTPGANQSERWDTSLAITSGSGSTQLGADGGVMSETLSSSADWALAAASFKAAP